MKTLKRLLSVALAATLAVGMACMTGCGNTAKADYTVGICQLVRHDALDAATEGFKSSLEAELKKEGKTVVFNEQNAQGDVDICSKITNTFVTSNVDLIMANATPALQSAISGTTKIPILGTSVTNYADALGHELRSDGSTGYNVSGTSDLADLAGQIDMLIELLPNVRSVGILYCSAEANSKYQAEEVKKLLAAKGVTAKDVTFNDSNDIQAVCAESVGKYDAMFVPTDNTAASNGAIIDGVFRAAKVPVFAGEEGICKACGFATLAISYRRLGEQTGVMAAKILLGKEKVENMPIERDENQEKKYSKERCEELGIKIPENAGYIAI